MKFSRKQSLFVGMLAAGVALLAATAFLPSPTTFGNETDDQRAAAEALAEKSAAENAAKFPPGPRVAFPPAAAPAQPPAAPIDTPASAPSQQAPTGGTDGAAAQPSAGNGGYLDAGTQTSLGYMLMGIGVALLGSGSIVWAYGRRRR